MINHCIRKMVIGTVNILYYYNTVFLNDRFQIWSVHKNRLNIIKETLH